MSISDKKTKKTTKEQLEAIVDLVDPSPEDTRDDVVGAAEGAEDPNEVALRLGIDVAAMAKGIRERILAAEDRAREVTPSDRRLEPSSLERKKRIDDARAAYAREVERLERRKAQARRDATRTRDEQLVVFQALLAKAPPELIGVHFHKYESASKEELDELIHGLRHLLNEEDEGEGDE